MVRVNDWRHEQGGKRGSFAEGRKYREDIPTDTKDQTRNQE